MEGINLIRRRIKETKIRKKKVRKRIKNKETRIKQWNIKEVYFSAKHINAKKLTWRSTDISNNYAKATKKKLLKMSLTIIPMNIPQIYVQKKYFFGHDFIQLFKIFASNKIAWIADVRMKQID